MRSAHASNLPCLTQLGLGAHNVRRLIKLVFGSWLALVAASSFAAPFPERPVTFVVAYTPGGVTDVYARAIGAKLTQMWGQPIVVDNKAGGGTIIGTQFVSRAPGDGYTLLVTSYAFTSNPVLRKNLAYDPASLTPLLLIGTSSSMLVVGATSPLKTLADVVARAKSAPGAIKFASSGMASSPHISAELFASQIGAEIVHVPYKGTTPAMTDVIGGQVDGIFDSASSMPNVRAGKLRAIAIAKETRHPMAPDVPTFRELGIDQVFGSWFGFFVPATTPQAIQQQLFADIRTAMNDPMVNDRIAKTALSIFQGSQAQFQEFLIAEAARFKKLVQSTGNKFAIE